MTRKKARLVRKCGQPGSTWDARWKAEAFIKALWERASAHEKAKLPSRSYRCDQCKQWHITSRPRTGKLGMETITKRGRRNTR